MEMACVSSMCLRPPDNDHALIVETLGTPTTAGRKKLCLPLLCCQRATCLKILNDNFTFNTGKIKTDDGQELSMVCSAAYVIDTTSNETIMKAYKSFPKGHRQVNMFMNSVCVSV